jgi:hypothetical protein
VPSTTVTVYATELMATGSVEEQRAHLSKLVLDLEKIVAHLPSSVSCGTKDGPIATNFASHEFDISEGPYYSFNKAWERTFQVSEEEKKLRVVRGKYGLAIVHSYLVHFSKIAGIEANGGLYLMAEQVAALISTIQQQ